MDIQKVVDGNDNVQLLEIAQELIRHVIASVDVINEDVDYYSKTLDFGNNVVIGREEYNMLLSFIKI